MRVVLRLSGASAREHSVPDLDQLRRVQEERLATALQAWEQEKQRLQEAVSRAESKERDYNQIAEDVKQRLAALDLVALMEQERRSPALQAPALQAPALPAPALQAPAPTALAPVPVPIPGPPPTQDPEPIIHRSSRPLFPDRRGRVLSILP